MRFVCMYCGTGNGSISGLTANRCRNSPTGKHVPYEGPERKSYTCMYCGSSHSSINGLTMNNCRNSPTGKHIPL